MTEIHHSLRSLFSATVTERNGSCVIEVPPTEIEHGAIDPGQTYRVAVLPVPDATAGEAGGSRDDVSTSERDDDRGHSRSRDRGGNRDPPVDEGEVREVTIETTGDQGDGIAKVDRGYVVIVPDGRPGETIPVEIDTVRPNVAFAHVIDER